MPPELDCAIFCDDIREEANNKVTLVGVYGTTLLLPADAKFPAALKQLCLFLRWRGVKGGEKLYLDIDFNGELVFKSPEPSVLNAPRDVNDYSQTSFLLVPMVFKGFGDFRFKVYLDERDQLLSEALLRVLPQPHAAPA